MSDLGWIEAALVSARPEAVAALLRYFRDLDTAEEAFQEASLRALRTWPENGPPRNVAGWLVMVGRNAALDVARRTGRHVTLSEDHGAPAVDDAEQELVEYLDASAYRDDILRLMFVCCHPALPATQQIALALRIVCGLPVPQIARAFLVGESAMEQRITRAKARIAAAGVGFEEPGPVERSERLAAVLATAYLTFNEGYSALGDTAGARAPLCDEAIRLARLLLRLFPSEPEVMGLLSLLLLQHSRHAARFDDDGQVILLDDQDRRKWSRRAVVEGVTLVEKAMRHGSPGPYQVQAAIAALHARARTPEETDWAGIDQLYAALERHAPSPVVTLNRSVAIARVQGPAAGLAALEPLAKVLDGYFNFHGVRGAFLMQLGRTSEAKVSFDRAISLARTVPEAAHIRAHLDRMEGCTGRLEDGSLS